MESNTYCLADLFCRITFARGQNRALRLLPSFEPFRVKKRVPTRDLLFSLNVDNTLEPFPETASAPIKSYENANGSIVVTQAEDGSYQFIVKNIKGESCSLLHLNPSSPICKCALRGPVGRRRYGLNNAIMMVFAFTSSRKNALLIHASTVRKDGLAYAFTAESGTGKSTHVAQWMAALPNCDIINDDNPIIRLTPEPMLYGSPWSGKTSCFRNTKAPLRAIAKVIRAEENRVEPSETVDSFITILTSCATMRWNSEIYNAACSTIKGFVEGLPIFNLYCLPNKQAAEVCFNALKPQEK